MKDNKSKTYPIDKENNHLVSNMNPSLTKNKRIKDDVFQYKGEDESIHKDKALLYLKRKGLVSYSTIF